LNVGEDLKRACAERLARKSAANPQDYTRRVSRQAGSARPFQQAKQTNPLPVFLEDLYSKFSSPMTLPTSPKNFQRLYKTKKNPK